MTNLNLSGNQSNDKQQKPAARNEDESIKNQTVGALGALAMFAAVIVIGSCSRSNPPVAVQPTAQSTAATAPTAPVPPPAPAPVVAKTKKHRAATLSYVNREYGLSFNFPRNYKLKTQPATQVNAAINGNETQAALTQTSTTIEPLPMNFVHPGGVALAAVEMPASSYPGTDFQSGFINVSVNPGMTAEACAQFAPAETNGGADASSSAKIVPVKIGTLEFQQVESSSDATTKPAGTKYYHVFGNGGCYEFGLGIATNDAGEADSGEIAPVDRQAVFARLENVLATVKIRPVVMPETPAPVPAVATTTPADSSNTAQPGAAPNF
ncbi:MAG TPA: hypothetical protein VEU11_05065 [Terriglobales bacterium]|nr:hypothetical protein [Terriglobales bacterium]